MSSLCTMKNENFTARPFTVISGVPEVLGGVAVAITWVFSVGYLLAYFFMVVLVLSHATVLRNMARERVKTFYERNSQPIRNRHIKRPFDSDLHSQLTFTERLSDTVSFVISKPLKFPANGRCNMNFNLSLIFRGESIPRKNPNPKDF